MTRSALVRLTASVLACASLAPPNTALAQPVPVADLGLLPGDTSVAPATNSQQDHAVARGGDQTLVVWSDYRSQNVGNATNESAGDIFAVRLDASGAPIDAVPVVVSAAMGVQRYPKVAWNGSDWLVIFESQDPVGGYFDTQIRAVRVSAQGEVLDPTPILLPPAQFNTSTIGLSIAGQNGQWLVTRCAYHDDGYGTFLAGQRIGASGQILDAQPLMLLDWIYGGLTVLAANGEYLVAGPTWNNSNDILAQRVGTNGQPIGAPFPVPSLNIATNGAEHYVTWIVNFGTLLGSRMTREGVLLTPAGTVVVPEFGQYTHSTLAHDGVNWWLEWGVSDILRTVRISGAGAVLDPNGGVLLPITIGGNVNTAYAPALIGRPGGGVNLFWYDLRVANNYDTNVFVLPISAANTPGAERCVSVGSSSQRAPDFAQGPGGQTALAFVSEFANDSRVLVHLLNAAGAPTTTEPIEVYRGASVGRVGIAWNGSVYLVTWDSGVIKARRMTPSGTFLDPAPFDVMPGFAPDVEALGDDFLIASSRYATYPQTIFAQAIRIDGPTGTPLDPGPFLLGGGYVSSGPRVRTDGSRWIVVYHSHWSHDDSHSDPVYNFVSASGVATSPRNPSTFSGNAGTPDVAFSGEKFLFVWRSNSLANANNYISGRIMNPDGSFATPDFTIAEAPGRQLRPVVGWDGSHFVVAWDDQRNQHAFFDERTDIFAARVTEAGDVLDPQAFAVSANPNADAVAAIACRPDGRSLVACARFVTQAPFDSYRIGLARLGDAPCPGDANGDNAVNFADLNIVLSQFGQSGAGLAGDVTGDGAVTFADLNLVLSQFGLVC